MARKPAIRPGSCPGTTNRLGRLEIEELDWLVRIGELTKCLLVNHNPIRYQRPLEISDLPTTLIEEDPKPRIDLTHRYLSCLRTRCRAVETA